MDKKFIVHKTVCDCCGEELDVSDKFILPTFTAKSEYAYSGKIPVIKFNHEVLEKSNCDLCINCQTKFAYLIKLMPYIKIKNKEVRIEL